MSNQESNPIDFSLIAIQELPRGGVRSRRPLLYGTAAAGLCVSLLVYGAHQLPESVLPTETEITQESTTLPPESFGPQNTDAYVCPAPKASDITAVERLFAQEPQKFDAPTTWSEEASAKYDEFYTKTIPSEYGLTLHVPDDVYDLDLYADQPPSFAKVLQTTQAFMKLYGVDVKVMTKSEAPKHNGHKSSIPSQDELETIESKAAVMALAEGISQVPEEFVRQTGLTNIWLVTKGDGFAAFAETGGDHNTIVESIDQTGTMGSEIFGHEFMHLVDSATCGGGFEAEQDPAIDDINSAIPYDSEMGDMTPRQFAQKRPYSYKDMRIIMRNYLDQPNSLMPCDLSTSFENSMKVFTQYSYKNVVEDKAEIGKNFFGRYNYAVILDKRLPAIRQKALVLLARIYNKFPNVVRYYAAVSDRPSSADPFCETQNK